MKHPNDNWTQRCCLGAAARNLPPALKRLNLSAAIAVVLAVLAWWLWTPDKDRAALERLYLKAPTDMVNVAGTRLHVRDSGPAAAPAVLMLHGFGASLHTWEPLAQGLQAGFRVIRIDLPGSGLSPPDATGVYSDDRTIDILLALMASRGIHRATLIGHSIGGRIAWTFAARHPEKMQKLVLISPDGFASPGFEYGKQPDVSWLLQAMRFVLPKSLLLMSLKPAYANPAVLTGPLADRYHDLMRAPGARQALLDRMAQTVLVNPTPLLQKITAPTLLVWGAKDAMIPVANAADYQAAMPSAQRVVLPGVGHLPQEEAPGPTLAAVLAFLLVPADKTQP